jgi:hypothetical protein
MRQVVSAELPSKYAVAWVTKDIVLWPPYSWSQIIFYGAQSFITKLIKGQLLNLILN